MKLSLLKSRKFKLTVAACLIACANALGGTISWEQAVWACISAIAVNVLGIAVEDAANAKNGGAK